VQVQFDDSETFIDRYGLFVLPDEKSSLLIGRIFGHPYIGDGNIGHTSLLRAIDFVSGWAITMNRVYSLGERLLYMDAEMEWMMQSLAHSLYNDGRAILFVPPDAN
jgi:hypothetical protein